MDTQCQMAKGPPDRIPAFQMYLFMRKNIAGLLFAELFWKINPGTDKTADKG